MRGALLVALLGLAGCAAPDLEGQAFGGGTFSLGFASTGGGPNGGVTAVGPVQALLVTPETFACGTEARAQIAVTHVDDVLDRIWLHACVPAANVGGFLPCGLGAAVDVSLSAFLRDDGLASEDGLALAEVSRIVVGLRLTDGNTGQSARASTTSTGEVLLDGPSDGEIVWEGLSWACDDGSTEPWASSATATWDFDEGVARGIDPLPESP